LEEELVKKEGIPFFPIRAKGLERKISLSLISTMFVFLKGVKDSFIILRLERPDIILGTGGYVTAPVLCAGLLRRIPIIIHEQNSIPGIVNKIFGRFAESIAVSFPDTEKYFPQKKKVVLTGNPVRKELFQYKKEEAYDFFEFSPDIQTGVIFGGSRGSKSINQAVIESFQQISRFRKLQIIHLTGKDDYERVVEEIKKIPTKGEKLVYRCYPYFEKIGKAYSIADFILARAGATTIAETTALGIPSIFVPYPYASEGHQEKNARYLEKFGAGRVVLDKDLSGETLYEAIKSLAFNEAALSKMRKKSKEFGRLNAANEIANLVLGLKASKEAINSYTGKSEEDISW
ncbi:MAG: undecaprenyldiphospho-muramoylpentapeptide beta-N-acetylglucosaminyltransferase, partial [Actinomycetia bacterium]|nr:undecaprenyldiphospho-muramoylpentapeptide beta-N-acetylglucosaminyltransferase [Actinomycetes bacterium]